MAFINNDTFFKRNSYLLIIAAWLLTIAFIINNYWNGTSTPYAVQKEIQKSVSKSEKKVNEFLKDSLLIRSIAAQNYDGEEINDLVKKPFYIFFYEVNAFREDVPVFWNTQIVEPGRKVLDEEEGTSFHKLLNGWYVSRKTSFQTEDGLLYKIICLIPVKWSYYIENQYLQNTFTGVQEVGNSYTINLSQTPFEIKDLRGKPLFYLSQTDAAPFFHDNIIALWLRIFGLLLVLFFIHILANYLVKKYSFLVGFLVLSGSLLLLRLFSYFLPYPFNFEHLELFNPEIYNSSGILKSLGDLLINSILFIWIVLFTRYHFRYDFAFYRFKKPYQKYLFVTVISVLMFLVTLICGRIVRTLVSDSKISFDVINFFSLNIYSAFGFIVLSCVAVGYFFLIQILLQPLNTILKGNKQYLYLFVAVAGLGMLTLNPHSPSLSFNICLLLWLLLLLYLLNFKMLLLQAYHLVSSRFIFWLFFFSVSITAVIIVENRIKELNARKAFAINLAHKADPSGPVMMNSVLTDFRNDYLADIFYKFDSSESNNNLKDSLLNENFSGYLNKYDTKIYTFDANEKPLYNIDSTNFNSLNTIIQSQGKPTSIPDLFYYDVSYDRFNYISKKEIVDTTGKELGYIFILSSPKKYKSDALYPELFSKGNANSLESSTVYAFAIYNKNKLSTSYNDYPFSTNISNKGFTHNEFLTNYKNGYEELWYKANADKIIVITMQDRFFIEFLTLFAYLFCSFLIVTVFFNLVSHLLVDRKNRPEVRSFFQITIRNQVHGTIILISIFSFLVIGVTTILFFISRYHSNNREKLSKTIHVMENELRTTIDTLTANNFNGKDLKFIDLAKLEKSINSVSTIHATDINLYDLEGNLKVSSVPFPYNKGIVSEKMDPVAFYHLSNLKDAQYFQQQQIGSLKYLSNYLPVRDENGREFAYLNIPYFESQNKLQDEISNFLVTIINLNAFIFLIAGIIALFITNTITRSFSIISDRMKQVNLQTGNEEIVWKRKDEIGDLVNEYNKMVRQLDVSAIKLAKSEREGAWREMARQVAHEIKNPLTPMKLNLQYLQMAIDNNAPDVKKVSLYVANILLEQIEHLSKIASDFAQFANIGNSKIQLFNVNHTLQNLITLYSANEEVTIIEDLFPRELLIKADKTQINRLFTNLLQNAVQAVPDFKEAIVEIKSELIADKVLVMVKDNGNGIPEAMLSKIFTPNFTTKSSGTGLGLAMCKGILEKINGRIWFETKENAWTVFYVEIPAVVE